ncbi:MAG: CapA family protein [Leptolyngbyaceae cyanobacterium RU_5_1]|nr:CapA family protein [Leptolyngbyaceae cyanobacterium RU_5_1]
MVQSEGLHYASVIELARSGNLRAIAQWLNQSLLPHGVRTYVGSGRSGCIKLLVELPNQFAYRRAPNAADEQLLRFICHRLWQLNSPVISGAKIAVRIVGQPQRILWQQSVRIVTPANRQRRQQTQHLRSRIRRTSRQKARLRTTRALLVGGPALAAIVAGGVLGYSRAPVGQTNASASSQPKDDKKVLPQRPDTVRTVLENVAVVKHNQVANPADPTVTLMFSGDVTLAEHFEEVVGNDYQRPFAALDEYRQADVSMVNLENPLTRATLPMPDKQFNFKSAPESVKVLLSGGVDIANIANNHTMDYEAEGLRETIATLDAAGIQHVGAGRDLAQARRPKVIDVKGQRIAYLSYYGDEYEATETAAGVNSIKEDRIAEDIRMIRDQVDWIVVNYHWGQELADFPADWQVQLGHFTIDQGADLVVGHHPHVLQGAEIYKGRAIAYSLGNFIFGGNSRTDYDTAILKVALKDRQMKVDFLPIEVRGYQPKVAEGDRATEILNHITQLSTEFKQPMKPSVVLDARTEPTPEVVPPDAFPTTPADPLAPTPPATNSTDTVPGSPADTMPSPDPLPSPDSEPTPPALPVPSNGVMLPSPAPTPIDPATIDILPGYGEIAPPATDAPIDSVNSPVEDPLNSTDPASAAPDSSSSEPPESGGPQLPTFSQPSNSFTDSPAQTPFKINQLPPQDPPERLAPLNSTTTSAPQLPPASMLKPMQAESSYPSTAPVSRILSFVRPTLPEHRLAAPEASDRRMVPPSATIARDTNSRSRPPARVKLPFSEPVEPEMAQDVALQAPMMW